MAALGLRDVALQHGPAYVARHAGLLPSHRAALLAIARCRTPLLGGHLARCADCGTEHVLLNSCRHRACPQCGHAATQRWLARQRQLLLPVPYFHVVFTVPQELRRAIRSHQRPLLDVLFRAAFTALSSVCAEPQHLGTGNIGALAVLHTWTRTLEWHPHIHMLVPGGGIAPDGRTWRPVRLRHATSNLPRKAYLVPVKKLSFAFRRIFLAMAARALPEPLPAIDAKPWVVFAKPIVHGAEKVLEYLGRYVHRTAIGNGAVVGVDDAVTFCYLRSEDGARRVMQLPADEFLRRFLQHVMARGFHRVRMFGLLHPSQRAALRRLQFHLASRLRRPPSPAPAQASRAPLRCARCRHEAVRVLHALTPAQCIELTAAVQPRGLSP